VPMDGARYVIKPILSPCLLNQITSDDVASTINLRDIARHVIKRILNPRLSIT